MITLKISEWRAILKTLEFYADPETYFAIGFFPDPPCGPFIKDGSKTELGWKPGKLARKTLEKLEKVDGTDSGR